MMGYKSLGMETGERGFAREYSRWWVKGIGEYFGVFCVPKGVGTTGVVNQAVRTALSLKKKELDPNCLKGEKWKKPG